MTDDKKSEAPSLPSDKQTKSVAMGDKPSKNDAITSITEEERAQIGGSLDTIKEILVGEHAREIHKKMNVLEDRITRELSNIQNHVTRRFESIESFMRKELELLREDAKKEQLERAGAFDAAMGELKNTSKAFEQKMTNSNQVTASRFGELRDQMLNESHALSEDILRRYREVYEEIEKTASGLESRKPDRQFIAGLLMRMAGALQAESLIQTENVTEFKAKAIKKSG